MQAHGCLALGTSHHICKSAVESSFPWGNLATEGSSLKDRIPRSGWKEAFSEETNQEILSTKTREGVDDTEDKSGEEETGGERPYRSSGLWH